MRRGAGQRVLPDLRRACGEPGRARHLFPESGDSIAYRVKCACAETFAPCEGQPPGTGGQSSAARTEKQGPPLVRRARVSNADFNPWAVIIAYSGKKR